MADLAVYRSTHQDVLAIWHSAHEQAKDIGRKRRALLDELGFEGRQALIAEHNIIGVEHRQEDGPIPEGWRRDSRTAGAIVPDRRRAVGKKLGKRLDGLTMPDLRKIMPGGMPHMVWNLAVNKLHWPGFEFMGGALYVKWGCDPAQVERAETLDLEVWERVKLSEYYAAVEREAEAVADA